MKKVISTIIWIFPSIIFAQGPAGKDKFMCKGGSIQIGMPSKGHCYIWKGGEWANSSQITVGPEVTTTYYLTVIKGNFESVETDDVTVHVVEKPSLENTPAVAFGDKQSSGAELFDRIEVFISACADVNVWHPVVITISGFYSEKYVATHPEVVTGYLQIALDKAAGDIKSQFENISIPFEDQSWGSAIDDLFHSSQFQSELGFALSLWKNWYSRVVTGNYRTFK